MAKTTIKLFNLSSLEWMKLINFTIDKGNKYETKETIIPAPKEVTYDLFVEVENDQEALEFYRTMNAVKSLRPKQPKTPTMTGEDKFKILDKNGNFQEFTLCDLRSDANSPQTDVSYFGLKRSVALTSNPNLNNVDEFKDCIELKNNQQILINGRLYRVIVKNLYSSNGVAFITKSTVEYIIKALQSE